MRRHEVDGFGIGFVGTYPPTRCGIATFTASLSSAMLGAGPDCRIGVVACVEHAGDSTFPPSVVAELVSGSPASLEAAAEALEQFDVVVVQHEFGIFGGADGDEVLDLLARLSVPVIAVLHTVPRHPTASQQAIIQQLSGLVERIVTQSEAARARLLEMHIIDAEKVSVIPHGAPANLGDKETPPDPTRAPVILTWGLIGPSKGIEHGIDAMALLRDIEPQPRYVIAGQTHPRIIEQRGEEYRDSLVARAAALGVDHMVEFDDEYRDLAGILAQIREADIVLLPYLSREQVVSGVLVEAIASGKPVVATRFPHAEELLSEGSGHVVPHEDAEAIAAALRRLLTDAAHASRVQAVARRQAPSLFWENVGESYLRLAIAVSGGGMARRLPLLPLPPFTHLLRLSDDAGVFEHAEYSTPRREHGYCTDDVARALIAVMREPRRSPELEQLAETALSFLESAQIPDGRFRNRLSAERIWLDEVGDDDTSGRALWALGTAVGRATRRDQRERAWRAFTAGAGFRSIWPRANAFAALGAVELLDATPRRPAGEALALLTAAAATLGRPTDNPDWPWPEPRLAYANAALVEARLAAGVALADLTLLNDGLSLLNWLVDRETNGNHFSFTPVGGRGPGDASPAFDQQPIEAAAMADACARAFSVTGEPRWAAATIRAAQWFLGANDGGHALLDPATGGGRDGLTANGVNENMGAESTLALITALQQARRIQAAARSSARSTSAATTVAAPTQRSAAPYVR